jgi:hypothetical protein
MPPGEWSGRARGVAGPPQELARPAVPGRRRAGDLTAAQAALVDSELPSPTWKPVRQLG